MRAFQKAFARIDHLIAYSMKANGNLSVLRSLAEMGCGADVTSGGELYRARRAGIPAERIVFAGVGKTVPEIKITLKKKNSHLQHQKQTTNSTLTTKS